MGIKLKNNAFATIPLALSSTATTLTVTLGQGGKFPTLGVGDYFYATINDTTGNYEIVKVTARVNDDMTITRAQEGTAAVSFLANSRIELRITAQTFADIMDGVLVIESYQHGNLV